MRYRVKIADKDLFQEVRAALRDNQVKVFAVSEKRGLLSTDPLPEDLASIIEERGGSVTPEFQYDMESVGPDRAAAG